MEDSNTNNSERNNTEHQTSRRQFITEAVAAGGIVGLAAGGATAASLAGQPSRTTQPARTRPAEAPGARPAMQAFGPIGHYLQFSAGGEDAPVLMGHDTTRDAVGGVDVSNMIECLRFEFEELPVEHQRQRPSSPAKFLLRTGKSTPFIFEALKMNNRVDLTLNIFEQVSRAGPVERVFQYQIGQGRVIYLRLHQPSLEEQAVYGSRLYLEAHVIPMSIVIESIPGGTVFQR